MQRFTFLMIRFNGVVYRFVLGWKLVASLCHMGKKAFKNCLLELFYFNIDPFVRLWMSQQTDKWWILIVLLSGACLPLKASMKVSKKDFLSVFAAMLLFLKCIIIHKRQDFLPWKAKLSPSLTFPVFVPFSSCLQGRHVKTGQLAAIKVMDVTGVRHTRMRHRHTQTLTYPIQENHLE